MHGVTAPSSRVLGCRSRSARRVRARAPFFMLAVAAACWRSADTSWREDARVPLSSDGLCGCWSRVPQPLRLRSRLRGGSDAAQTAELRSAEEEGPRQFPHLGEYLQEVSSAFRPQPACLKCLKCHPIPQLLE